MKYTDGNVVITSERARTCLNRKQGQVSTHFSVLENLHSVVVTLKENINNIVSFFSAAGFNHVRAAPSPRAHALTPLTCVPELLVPIHGEDDQEIAQDVNDDGEDEEASQSCGDPRRAVQDGVAGFWRGAVQERPIYNHCIQSLNFLS